MSIGVRAGDCGAGRAVADGGQRFGASSMNWRRLLGFQSARRRSIHVKEVKAGAVRDGGRGGRSNQWV